LVEVGVTNLQTVLTRAVRDWLMDDPWCRGSEWELVGMLLATPELEAIRVALREETREILVAVGLPEPVIEWVKS
jgi:hypothetical protein